MKRFIQTFVLGIVALGLMSSCGEENEPLLQPSEVIENMNLDLAGGRLVHIVNVADLKASPLPLNILRQVDIETAGSEYFRFECRQGEDGKWYAVPIQKKEMDVPFEVVPLKVSLKGHPELARNVLVVFRNESPTETKATNMEAPISVYSEVIGKGTRCYEEFGNTLHDVLLCDQIDKLSREYFTPRTNEMELVMTEFSGSSYEQTVQDWAFNVGASFQKTIPGEFEPLDVDDIKSLELIQKPGHRWSGTFSFGMSGNISRSEAYEYYLNLYRVKMGEVYLNMPAFEGKRADVTLLCILSDRFKEDVRDINLDPISFFDTWGTDVITQGSFGGYNIYLYGRKENIYEHSVGFDAAAQLKQQTTNNKAPSSWLELYLAQGSDYWSANADVSYMENNYSEASKAITFQYSTGGNLAINDPQKWLDGFNQSVSESSNRWALISYTIDSDEQTDGLSSLYPIEQIVLDYAYAYTNKVGLEMTPADREAVNVIVHNYNKLVRTKELYLEAKQATLVKDRSRLVVADLIVKKGSNGHKKGEPKPFVAEDPNRQGEYLIYYPMMANKYAPCDRGYAFETSQDDYIVGVDLNDKYWYYAMAPSDDCQGIVDVVCGKKSEIKDKVSSQADYYVRRGVDALEGSGVAPKENYLYVKYYDEGFDLDPAKKITAVGLFNPDTKHVMASTGGSELRHNATQSEVQAFDAFWRDEETTWYNKSWKNWNYIEGAVTVHNPFYAIYSTATLPVSHMREGVVWQPKKWGE